MKRKVLLPDPEQLATDVLERSGQQCPPVDLISVAALWPGLHVSVEDIDKAGYLIDLGIHGGEIIAREKDPLARQRFTIAHELGHWVLQRKVGLSELPDGAESSGAVEDWCEQFASNLLLPREWLLKDLRRDGAASLARALLRAPDTYHVSAKALCRRVTKIAPLGLFYLQQRGEAVEIEKHYFNGHVSPKKLPASITGAVNYISLLLPRLSQPELQTEHAEFGLRSILTQLRAPSKSQRQWLLIVLPKAKTVNLDPPHEDGVLGQTRELTGD